jgi:hypothetical protein
VYCLVNESLSTTTVIFNSKGKDNDNNSQGEERVKDENENKMLNESKILHCVISLKIPLS